MEQYSFQGAPRSLLALILKKKKKCFFNFLPAVDSRQELGFEARKLGRWKLTGSLRVLFLAQGKSSKTHRRLEGQPSGSRPPRPPAEAHPPRGGSRRATFRVPPTPRGSGERSLLRAAPPAEEFPQKSACRSQDRHAPLRPRSYVRPRPSPRPHGPRPRAPWAVPPRSPERPCARADLT